MARARLRRLRVDDREYTWTAKITGVSGERDHHRCVRLRVWDDDRKSRALEADLLSNAWGLPWGSATDTSHPKPGDVRAVIDYALANGWDPTATGAPFFLSERDHAFELPDFILTDRLRDPSAPDPTDRVIDAYERQAASADG